MSICENKTMSFPKQVPEGLTTWIVVFEHWFRASEGFRVRVLPERTPQECGSNIFVFDVHSDFWNRRRPPVLEGVGIVASAWGTVWVSQV